jgi:hypothetical protein
MQLILLMGGDMAIGLLMMRGLGLWTCLHAAPLSRSTLLDSRIASTAAIALISHAVAMIAFGVRIEVAYPDSSPSWLPRPANCELWPTHCSPRPNAGGNAWPRDFGNAAARDVGRCLGAVLRLSVVVTKGLALGSHALGNRWTRRDDLARPALRGLRGGHRGNAWVACLVVDPCGMALQVARMGKTESGCQPHWLPKSGLQQPSADGPICVVSELGQAEGWVSLASVQAQMSSQHPTSASCGCRNRL